MFVQRSLSTIRIFFFLLQIFTRLVLGQAPNLSEPGIAITDEQLNATYTHLVGFEDCNLPEQREIVQAFWDAAAVLNRNNIRNTQHGDTGINWQGPAAIELLGAPFSTAFQGAIQDLYSHAATFEPSYIHWPTDFTINARCDDPLFYCTCPTGDTAAYVQNSGGSNNNGPYMNFCPRFFDQPALAQALRLRDSPPYSRYNVRYWQNQAETFMHEMFHIDRVANSPPNRHVTDVWLQWTTGVWSPVYGAELARVLGRTLTNTGSFVIRSAENLMYFAMITHYQAVLGGEYPSRPFATEIPIGDPLPHRPGARPPSLFDIKDNKLEPHATSVLANVAISGSPSSMTGTCSVEPVVTMAAMDAQFAEDKDYPEEYRKSLSSYKSTWDAYWATQTDFPSSETPTSFTTLVSTVEPATEGAGSDVVTAVAPTPTT